MDYQHARHNVHLVIYPIIWCPKRRWKVLVGPVRERLQQLVEKVASEQAWQIVRLAMQPDHVQVVIRANPYTVPSAIPRHIKGRSAHNVREEFPSLRKLPSRWTCSCFLRTAGTVSQEVIQRSSAQRSSARQAKTCAS